MILGKSFEGQAILLRCDCSHDFISDLKKYGDPSNIKCIGVEGLCPKCSLFGWAIQGLDYKQLRDRDRINA